jgi:4-amino-4-deoxy-L-arabinose transferase-like glycosyltransferase
VSQAAWLVLPLSPLAGWLLWTRLPAAAGEQDDPLETAFASLVAGVLLCGCLALLLTELGVLRPAVLAGALAIATLVLSVLPRHSPPAARVPRGDVLATAFVVAFALVTLAPGSEEVLGGRDEGVYTNIAAWVADHGTLRIRSEALASVAEDARPVFHTSVVLPGFYVGDASRGEIFPQFLHLHPIYMAIGFWLGGVRSALLVPVLYGLLTLLGTFFLVRRLLGPWPALVAVLVLGLNFAQIWVLRTPFSEGAAQFAAAAALWCLARAAQAGGMRWGVLAGLAIGAGLLVRVDSALLLIALFPALAVVHASTERPARWATWGVLPLTIGCAAWAAVHGYVFTPRYMAVMDNYLLPLWALTAVLTAAYAASLILRPSARTLADRVYHRGRRWWVVAAVVVVGAFVFAMWIRPEISPWLYEGRRVSLGSTMVRVTWYFSLVGMVTACAGIVVLLRRWLVERRIEWVPFLAVFIAISAAYFWNPRVAVDHPWAMRRFIPVIVPGIAVAVAAALSWLWHAARWRPVARALAVVLLATVLIHETRLTLPFWNFREKGGSIEQLAEVARHIPPGAVLLYTTGLEPWVATPLACVWGHEVLPVVRQGRTRLEGGEAVRLFERQVTEWLKDGRPVLYLTRDDGHWRYLTPHLAWDPVTTFRFVVHRAGLHVTSPPRGPSVRVDNYNLVRLRLPPEPPPRCAGLSFDSAGSVAGRAEGFHGSESGRGGVRFRWVLPESRVLFPACDRQGAGRPSTLLVRARCSRGREDAPCHVGVTVNGIRAGELPLTARWVEHAIAIPPQAVAQPHGPVDVRLSGPKFTAARTGRFRDRRILSFQLKGLALR